MHTIIANKWCALHTLRIQPILEVDKGEIYMSIY